ncbi:MAG: hypothetical protein ACI82I_001072 [Gammaproteobacteria bacterium]|jgi:hypothetical protein
MRELFVHIGAHKTGTTSLQSCFEDQAKTLRKLGVFYPKTNWYHHSQHRLAFAMKGQKDPTAGDLPDLATEVAALNHAIASSDCDKVIISSEEFFSCSAETITDFKDLLDVDAVRIIASLRRPDTLLVSMYNQKIKHPGNNFAPGILPFVQDPRILDRDMDFKACMDPWMETFGSDNTTVLLYEDGGTITQMLKVLGLPEDALRLPARLNESLPGVVIEMMRIAKFMHMDVEQQKKLYQLASREMAGRPAYFLADEHRRNIIRELQPAMGKMFKQLGRENPYKLAHYVAHGDEARPNITMADLMQLIDTLLKKQWR